MIESELIKTFITYHVEMTRRVWESIDQITEEQFLAEDTYSRGSIRNLMVHIASTDRRWLAGVKNQPGVGHLNLEEYPTQSAGREVFENIAKDLLDFVATLTNEDLAEKTLHVGEPRWQVLLHIVNHGTDHRSTVLQKLHEFGAPTFPQDFIIWLWERK
jgi:uncharacterized damage-inducible protein DinB